MHNSFFPGIKWFWIKWTSFTAAEECVPLYNVFTNLLLNIFPSILILFLTSELLNWTDSVSVLYGANQSKNLQLGNKNFYFLHVLLIGTDHYWLSSLLFTTSSIKEWCEWSKNRKTLCIGNGWWSDGFCSKKGSFWWCLFSLI